MQLRRGYTIIEVLVALFIFGVVFLGLFATISVVIMNNLENLKRNEAVRIAEESLESLRNKDFSKIEPYYLNNGTSNCLDSLNNNPIRRRLRNFEGKFGRYYRVYDINSVLKKVQVEVCWKNRGKVETFSDETFVRKEK